MQKENIKKLIINIVFVSVFFILGLIYIYNNVNYKSASSSASYKGSSFENISNKIIIDKLNINLPIEEGITKDVLDKNVVGLYKEYSSFLDDNAPIILAGHNNTKVFRNLYNIDLNDEIEVIYDNNEYVFKVDEINVINKDNLELFYKEYDKKMLILITCKTKDTRFIVYASKI